MTKKYKLTNIILGTLIGIFASAVYIMTAEPTASWWDCGEYISTDYKLLVGHPPGAPTFQLLGRIFSMFAGGDVTKVAFCINCLSAIASGLTIMFLFWTITMLGRKLVAKSGEMTTGRMIAVFGSALVGSLAYTFTDTFWFSAVEGEVYALSSFFTALVFWCILKWEYEFDHRKEGVNPNRWIVLIAYLIGLSIGVHLLNLLTIPAIVLIVYFKLSPKASAWGVALTVAIVSFIGGFFCPTTVMLAIWLLITAPLTYLCFKHETFREKAEWGVFFALVGSALLVGIILWGIIPWVVSLAGKFEVFFINKIGLPFNSGTIIFFLFLTGIIFAGLYVGYRKRKNILLITTYSFLVLLIGYSTFFVLVIRSNANPTIDENNPEDAVALLAYLNREQYGETPFLYGATYNSRPYDYEEKDPVYVRDEKAGKYIITQHHLEPKYKSGQKRFLPRLYNLEKKKEYANWVYGGEPAKEKKMLESNKIPEYSENIAFMHKYQFNYMYFRYFMWNFSGRQNDRQGLGDKLDGNWISGISFLDRARLGDQPDGIASLESKGHNKYYMLPLLLGIIGLVFYSMRDTKNSFIVFLLFVMTGIAIAFYLNMYAYQPRERDYAFAASFYAFCIWIGFGVYALYSLFEKFKSNMVQIVAPVAITLVCLLLVPGILAKENWDDHDRSNRYTALATAKAYLDSCEPNAILFTMGDNDTFPLWYAQEVEGYRTDVRVCNLSLLSAGWYVDQMKRRAYESAPLPIDMTWEQYRDGSRDVIYMQDAKGSNLPYRNLKEVMKVIKSCGNSSRLCSNDALMGRMYGMTYVGENICNRFRIIVDKDQVIKTKTVRGNDINSIVDTIEWETPRAFMSRSDIMVLEILANNDWNRPIYFAKTTNEFFGLEKYLQDEGFAYRFVPLLRNRTPNTDILYNNVMYKFDDHTRPDAVKEPDALKNHKPYPYDWGGINDPRVYNSEDNFRVCYTIQSMHVGLVQSLISEFNHSGDKCADLYKLQRAEQVLDHMQKILPNDVIPYTNSASPHYTLRFLDAANLYNGIADSYSNALADNAELEGQMDIEQLNKKANQIRSIILGQISEELNYYNHAKNPKTIDFHETNISIIYHEILPELLDCVSDASSNLPAGKSATAFLNDAKELAETLQKDTKSLVDYMNSFKNFKTAISDGDEIWVDYPDLPKAQLESTASEFARLRGYINTINANYKNTSKIALSLEFLSHLKDKSIASQAEKILKQYNEGKAEAAQLKKKTERVPELKIANAPAASEESSANALLAQPQGSMQPPLAPGF
ncbi:MAG: DUF2723 domain-containing protein [Bacteroidales bacterium]|nr:DUF2723 domain-containing protein [Bacteroidales bacterium]